jgi:hypothetical protein
VWSHASAVIRGCIEFVGMKGAYEQTKISTQACCGLLIKAS